MTTRQTAADIVCIRCHRDTHSPKAYSMGNNMHPGPVPMELLVGIDGHCVCGILQCCCVLSHLISFLILSSAGSGRYADLSSDAHNVSVQTAPGTVWVMLSTSPRCGPLRVCLAFPLNWMSLLSGLTRAIGTSVSDVQWLVTHNQYYHSVGVTIDTTALDQLPQDGNISKLVSVAEDTTTDSPSTSGTAAAEDDLCKEDLPQSFIPVAAPSMAEQETVQQSVQQRQSSQPTLMWPSIGGIPLNEFTTEVYFTCAFPTLFPT